MLIINLAPLVSA